MKYYLIFVISVLFIVGCGQPTPNDKRQIVVKVETEYVVPPKSMVRVYDPPPPVDENVYKKLTYKQRNKVLSAYVIDLYGIIGKYRKQTITLRQWIDKQKKLEKDTQRQ